MQPTIVKNQGNLTAVQDDIDQRYNISGDAMNFADGDGKLPGGDIEKNWWDHFKKPSTPDGKKAEIASRMHPPGLRGCLKNEAR